MNMKIKDSIVWTAFLAVMAIIMFPSCYDEHEAGILEITNKEANYPIRGRFIF